MAAFQLSGDRFLGGLFGIDAFGTSPFGGPQYGYYTLPILQIPSDDISGNDNIGSSEIIHRRLGAIIGIRKQAEVRSWRIVMQYIGADVKEALRTYWSARKFNLLQDDTESGRVVEVVWKGRFNPERQRGEHWNFDFEIEEVL